MRYWLWLILIVPAFGQITVTEPDPSDTISGFSFDFTVDTSAQPTTASVEWFIDQRKRYTATSAPFTFNATTYEWWNGVHKVYAVAKNSGGTILATSAENEFTIANGSDTIAVTPSTAATSPWSGNITFAVTITESDAQPTNCYLYVDGVEKDSQQVSTGNPCNNLNIDTTTLENGARRIYVGAQNAFTNVARGMWEHVVTVANTSTNQIAVEASSEIFLAISGTATLSPRIRLADSTAVASATSLPATDNFNRSNSSSLTGNWTTVRADIQIVSNTITGNNANVSESASAFYNAATFPENQFAELTIVSVNSANWVGPAVRMRPGEFYYVCGTNGTTLEIYAVVAGTSTLLASNSTSFTASDVLRCEVSGTGGTVSLTAKKNGSSVLTASDTDSDRILYGQAGVWTYAATGATTADNFNAGALDGSSQPTATYLSSNTGIATVSSAGLVTGIAAGDTDILVFARGLSRTVHVSVNTTNNFPHFSNTGTFLTSYTPSQSWFLRSWFFSNESQLSDMTAQYLAAGNNVWENSMYLTPSDGESESAWKTRMDGHFSSLSSFGSANGLKIIGTAEEMVRTATALYKATRGVWRTWTPDSVTYGFQKAKDLGLMVGIEMADEISFSWGNNPYPQGTVNAGGPFTQIIVTGSPTGTCTATWTNFSTSGAHAVIVTGATSDTDLNSTTGSTFAVTYDDADHFHWTCPNVGNGAYNASTDPALTINVFADQWFATTDYIRNDAFTTLMTNANAVSSRTPIAWPVSGSAGPIARQNWSASNIAEYASMYWASSSRRHPYGQFLNDMFVDMRTVYREHYAVLQRDKPFLMKTDSAGPMYRVGGVPTAITSIDADSTVTFSAAHNFGSLNLKLDRLTASGGSALNGDFYVWDIPSTTTAKIAHKLPVHTGTGSGGTATFDGGQVFTVFSMTVDSNGAQLVVIDPGACELASQAGKRYVLAGNSNSDLNRSWFWHTNDDKHCTTTSNNFTWEVASTASTGGTAYVITTNTYIQGRNELMVQGVHPRNVLAGFLYAVLQGAAGVRNYGLSNQNPDEDTNADLYFQNEPSSGDGLNYNAGPLYNVNGMQERWNASALGSNMVTAVESMLLQPRGAAPDYGPGIMCTYRTGPNGRLIGCLNVTEGYLTREFDLSTLVGSTTRYRLTEEGMTTANVTTSTESLTIGPGEAIVWAAQGVNRISGTSRLSGGARSQ